ncbi:UNVERIFIED_CONTAM: Pathogenesis-related thaumatin-like protein 3.5 [Sesamum angustifolium]
MFKRACPRAYSYAYDDGTSTFTCKASEYAIMFCPNSGMRRIDDPPVRESSNERIKAGIVSSSATLLPFPISVLLLVLALYA